LACALVAAVRMKPKRGRFSAPMLGVTVQSPSATTVLSVAASLNNSKARVLKEDAER
jgi:hypothetical protein